MKTDYKPRDILLLNRLLQNIYLVNMLPETVLTRNFLEDSIIQLGNNIEEKLFLLNAIIEEVISKYKITQVRKDSVFNENAIVLIGFLKDLLREIEPVYIIKVMEIPGVEIPCSTLFEAKSIAQQISFPSSVLYNDQVIFTVTH